MIILLLGKRGAGKSSGASFLSTTMSLCHIEMSSFLKLERIKEDLSHLRLREYVSLKHKFEGKDFGINRLKEQLVNSSENHVITGIRNPVEIRSLKDFFGDHSIFSIYIQCDILTRWSRVTKRDTRSSFGEFIIEEYYSIKWGDPEIKRLAEILIHNSSIKSYHESLKSSVAAALKNSA